MNLISKTPRYAYLRVSVDALLYAHLVRQFGGHDNLALRELRHRFNATVQRLVADGRVIAEPERQRIP